MTKDQLKTAVKYGREQNHGTLIVAIPLLERLLDIAEWSQATLTALNVGDVKSESPLHLKLREVMIALREVEP